jgi:hypothetical protein
MSVRKRVSYIKARRTVRYQAEVYVRGVRLQCRTFDTAAAAHAWHDETKNNLELGQHRPSDEKCFKDVVEDYKNTAFQELRKSS